MTHDTAYIAITYWKKNYLYTSDGSILNVHRLDVSVSWFSYLHLREGFFAEVCWPKKCCHTKSCWLHWGRQITLERPKSGCDRLFGHICTIWISLRALLKLREYAPSSSLFYRPKFYWKELGGNVQGRCEGVVLVFPNKSRKPTGSVLRWPACNWRLAGLHANANKLLLTTLLLFCAKF